MGGLFKDIDYEQTQKFQTNLMMYSQRIEILTRQKEQFKIKEARKKYSFL